MPNIRKKWNFFNSDFKNARGAYYAEYGTVKNSDPKTLIGAHTTAYEMNILLKLACEQNRNIEHAEFVVVLKSRKISFAIDTSVI